MSDCEEGGAHTVEEFADGETRCTKCCRAWAPLDALWTLRATLAEREAEMEKLKRLVKGLQIPGPLGQVWGSMEWQVYARSEENAKEALYFSDLAKRQHEKLKTTLASLTTARAEALEEAAKLADRLAGKTIPMSRERASLVDAVERIRALADTKEGERLCRHCGEYCGLSLGHQHLATRDTKEREPK